MARQQPQPGPFAAIPHITQGLPVGPWRGTIYWHWPDPWVAASDDLVFLFPPEWDGQWPGKGFWRIGHTRRGDTVVSPCYNTPDELWPWYITYVLTGDWSNE